MPCRIAKYPSPASCRSETAITSCVPLQHSLQVASCVALDAVAYLEGLLSRTSSTDPRPRWSSASLIKRLEGHGGRWQQGVTTQTCSHPTSLVPILESSASRRPRYFSLQKKESVPGISYVN